MRFKNNSVAASFAIIAGILLAYIMEMCPSPFLQEIERSYELGGNDALLNLSVSVIFPAIIVSSILGGRFEEKLGTYGLYIATLVFVTVGLLLNLVAWNYAVFLAGRIVFGLGFGLGIPFIGSAIMKWYPEKRRDSMNTLNALFPFIGTLISYAVMNPLISLFGKWPPAMAVWGAGTLLILMFWALCISPDKIKEYPPPAEESQSDGNGSGLYAGLIKRREIRGLSLIFMCDFFCYSFISVVIPTLAWELGAGELSEAAAGALAALAFPAFGLVGCFLGGLWSQRSGRRKPVLLCGQVFKLIGVFVAVILARVSVYASMAGFALFGIGNGMWMPVMYCIPMDLKGMDSAKTGAAFALMSACGFVCGFISPTVGGWLTDWFSARPAAAEFVSARSYGMIMSLLIFNAVNLISVWCAARMRETGRSAVSGRDTEQETV